MRRDYIVAIWLTLAAIAAGVCLMVAPAYLDLSPQTIRILFWGGLILMAVFLLAAIAVAARGKKWKLAEAAGQPLIDNRKGTMAGRDAIGTQNNYFGPPSPLVPPPFPEPPRMPGRNRPAPQHENEPERTTRRSLGGVLEPTRDISLQDAVCFAVYGHWPTETEVVFRDQWALNKASIVAERMRELAGDEKLLIWGKRQVGTLYELAPPNFWYDHQIEFIRLVSADAESVCTERVTNDASYIKYTALMVSRAQMQKLWP